MEVLPRKVQGLSKREHTERMDQAYLPSVSFPNDQAT